MLSHDAMWDEVKPRKATIFGSFPPKIFVRACF